MASANVAGRSKATGHGGAPAPQTSAWMELRRSCLAALLHEDMFYEAGATHAARVRDLIRQVEPERVAALAVECREQQHLRHVPLFLVACLGRHPKIGDYRGLVGHTLERVIQRPDELAEFCAIFWNLHGRKLEQRRGRKDLAIPISFRRGLARAFAKFDAYKLGKYRDEGKAVSLVDVLKMARPKPKDKAQAKLWKSLRAGTLPTPDTWETELSAGKDKTATWTRLLKQKKLGGLALLRNLRNMTEAGVDSALVTKALKENTFERVLPFRFIAAGNHAPEYVNDLSDAMERTLAAETPTIKGDTVLLVDVSGSMDVAISAGKKHASEMTRMDAACGLAMLAAAKCERLHVFSFSDNIVRVKSFKGLALADAVKTSQGHSGTALASAVHAVNAPSYDRLIVLTDEQSNDGAVPLPKAKHAYMVNVASYEHGVGFGGWTRITGWSERTLDFIAALEADE